MNGKVFNLSQDDDVVEEVVNMTGIVAKRFEDLPMRIDHPLYENNKPWPRKTNVVCWHDCHPFDGMPVPFVSRYCHETKQVVCFGNFCSPNCARAYAIEHKPLSYQHVLVYYTYILTKSFGIPPEDCSAIANPRECLVMFGGTQSIHEFRKEFSFPRRFRVDEVSFKIQNLSICEVLPDINQIDQGLDSSTRLDKETKVCEIATSIIAQRDSSKRKEQTCNQPNHGVIGKQTSLLEIYVDALQSTDGDIDLAKQLLLNAACVPKSVQTKRTKST